MIQWIMQHQADLLGIYSGLVTLASLVVRLTPNKTASKILYGIIKVSEVIGWNTQPVQRVKKV